MYFHLSISHIQNTKLSKAKTTKVVMPKTTSANECSVRKNSIMRAIRTIINCYTVNNMVLAMVPEAV